MNALTTKLIALLPCPAIIIMLEFVGRVALQPLGRWSQGVAVLGALLPALAAGCVALLIPPRNARNSTKAWAIGVSLIGAVYFALLYEAIADEPPAQSAK